MVVDLLGYWNSLSSVLGTNRPFDTKNEEWSWRQLLSMPLGYGQEMQSVWSLVKKRGLARYGRLVAEVDKTVANYFEQPLEGLGKGGVCKLGRVIRGELNKITFRLLEEKLVNLLSVEDTTRMAFRGAALDSVSNALLRTRPVQGWELTSQAWLSSVAAKYGLADPMCTPYIGKSFRPNRRDKRIVVDPRGYGVKGIAGAKGPHAHAHHDRMVNAVVTMVADSGIVTKGGIKDQLLNFIGFNSEMRPDIYIDASAENLFNTAIRPLFKPTPTLFDVKTLAVGELHRKRGRKTYHEFPTYGFFNIAVNERQRQVGLEYFRQAKKIDKSPEGEDGPTTKQLQLYGVGGLVIGLVFGGFFEVSAGVHDLMDLAARAKAAAILKHAPRDTKPEIILAGCRRRLNSELAIASARSWARLLRERLTSFFPGPAPS